ncbi:hypothetical protein P3X46_024501 [Hevea brasiliensis]|uniref:TF-B3 domain-containing protein n=1 Tax=Hevea brasiliensis TaxID=3981 RepID=A0ABQ9L466_HEVBR|nr:hypothetical protein P3X46_024501 [Hevea brasiliensis]
MPSSSASSHPNSSSSLPIFCKSLTKIDVEKKLAVPTKALTHLPSFGDSHHFYIEAKDDRGYFWSFQCSIRRNGHPKPILSSGTWLPFVRYRSLRVGDTIKLYKEHDQFTGVDYKIEVDRMGN